MKLSKCATALLGTAIVCVSMLQALAASPITEYPVPTANSKPGGITAGPDGNLWFTQGNSNRIARLTTAGVLTEFPLPAFSQPEGITLGPDGNLWFTEANGEKIGRITPAGVITEFPLPRANSEPNYGIVAGPDGNLWFTEDGGNRIGRITPAGVITEYPIPTPVAAAQGIAAGPDGNLWFTEVLGNKIGRITTGGVITEFPLPTPDSGPGGIVAGPDGNLWFTESFANRIGRITPTGAITEYPIPTAYSGPWLITVGPDGNLWFTEETGNKIGVITTSGVVIAEYSVPTAGADLYGIATGPDGNLWFAEYGGNRIGKLTPSGQAIVGAWSLGDTTRAGSAVVVFLGNGYYFTIDNPVAADAPGAVPGFERGTYTWNPETGAFTVRTIQDTNGPDAGFSWVNSVSGLTVTVSGNIGTLNIPGRSSLTVTRVTGASPIVGAWFFGNPAVADSSAVIVVLPNNTFFFAQDGDPSPVTGDPTGQDGIEHGTYSWNPSTGALTTNCAPAPYVDTNRYWGLCEAGVGGSAIIPASADRLSLTVKGDGDTIWVPRIGAASPTTYANFEGVWWTAPGGSESGWGLTVTHQGDVVFLGWFTYDATGKTWWLSMTAPRTAEGTYAGALIQSSGPAFNALPFDPARVTRTAVGTGTLTFSDASNGSFAYTVNGASQTKPITRVMYDAMPNCTYGAQPDFTRATNYQNVWWVPAGAESGWGLVLTHQGDTIFAGWFTYDADGTPLWLSATVPKTAAGVYAGTLIRTTGPAFNAVPWDPNRVTRTPVGTMTLTFANGNSGTFSYAVNTSVGTVTQAKALTRVLFAAPSGTLCQ